MLFSQVLNMSITASYVILFVIVARLLLKRVPKIFSYALWSNVMLAGGMNEIDGWITEDESMGKPMLVFSYKGSKLQYLGHMRSGEADFSKLAGQEIALRGFLEGKGLLPNGFYIYNPHSYPMHFQVTEQTEYSIINWSEGTSNKYVTVEGFIQYLEQHADATPPFTIVTKNGYVQSITEQYVP